MLLLSQEKQHSNVFVKGTRGMKAFLAVTHKGLHKHLLIEPEVLDRLDQGKIPENLHSWSSQEGEGNVYGYFHVDYDRRLVYTGACAPWITLAEACTYQLKGIRRASYFGEALDEVAISKQTLENIKAWEAQGWFFLFEVYRCAQDYACSSSQASISSLIARERARWWRRLQDFDYLFLVRDKMFLSLAAEEGRLWPKGKPLEVKDFLLLLELGEWTLALQWLESLKV